MCSVKTFKSAFVVWHDIASAFESMVYAAIVHGVSLHAAAQ